MTSETEIISEIIETKNEKKEENKREKRREEGKKNKSERKKKDQEKPKEKVKEKPKEKTKIKGQKNSSDNELAFLDIDDCYNTSKTQMLQINSAEKSNESLNTEDIRNLEDLEDLENLEDEETEDSSDSSFLDSYGKFCKNPDDSTEGNPLEDKVNEDNEDNNLINFRIIDSDQLVLPNDKLIIIKSKIPIRLSLPEFPISNLNNSGTEVNSGRYLKIKNKNDNVDVLIIPSPGNTINDLTSYILKGKRRTDLVYTGKTWTTV